jgi:hypothetical protein
LVAGSSGLAWPGRSAIPKPAEAGGAGNQAKPATSADTRATARPARNDVRFTITFLCQGPLPSVYVHVEL